MARYHVSEDGTPRVCKAQSPESCTARGVDGDPAPHGDFADANAARRFAESVIEDSSIGSGLVGIGREATPGVPRSQDTPAAIMVDNTPAVDGWKKIRDLESGDRGAHLEGPMGVLLEPQSSGQGWDLTDENGSDQGSFDSLNDALEDLDRLHGFSEDEGYAQAFRDAEHRSEGGGLIGTVADRTAFSTDMTDSSEYRVEEGKLKAVFEGESYSLGELREVSPEEVNSWSQASFGEDAKFQDGEVFPVYDEDGDAAGAFARFGDKFYRAGTGGSFYQA